MFNKKCDCTEEMKQRLTLEMQQQVAAARHGFELDLARLKTNENDKVRNLESRVVGLEADLKIAKDQNAKIEAEQKSKYAEHVMAVTDERVKEMRTMYEGYAKNLTEVVKAAAAGGANVNTSVVTK